MEQFIKGSKQLGSYLATLRYHKNLSQEKLVAKFQLAGWDVSRSTYSKIELGSRYVSFDELNFIAEALGTTKEKILEEIEKEG